MTEYHTNADTARLTAQFPVPETLKLFAFASRHYARGVDVGDRMAGYDLGEFALRSSPAKHPAVENLLGQLVSAAAREGAWVGADTGWSLEDLTALHDQMQRLHSLEVKRGIKAASSFALGVSHAMDAYLLDFAIADERVYVMPKDGLPNFIQRKAAVLDANIMLP